jgi:hypothetical protein
MPSVVKTFSLLQIILMLQVSALFLPGATLHVGQDRLHHELQQDGAYGEVCVSPNVGVSSKKSMQGQEVTSDMPASSPDSFPSSYTPPLQEGVRLFSSFLLRTITTSSDL